MLGVVVGGLMLLALAFEFTNGGHDTAHAAGTVVASGALSYWPAVCLSGFANALGAGVSVLLTHGAVALFIAKVVAPGDHWAALIGGALIPGLAWNLYTCFRGSPVSSTHCLLGGLTGAGVAAAGMAGVHWKELGLALLSLLLAPFIAYVLAYLVASILQLVYWALPASKQKVKSHLPKLQIGTSFLVSFAHGNNDGQKTMGILMVLLACAYPSLYTTSSVVWWVVALCSLAIGAGTIIAAGPTMRAIEHKMSQKKITAETGTVSELVTVGLIMWGGATGVPLSTTQTCMGSILGAARGSDAANPQWRNIVGFVKNWILTFPITGLTGFALTWGLIHLGKLFF